MNMNDEKKCDFCIDPNFEDNPIFSCINCGVNIHVLCYGIQKKEKENWKCSACENGCTEDVSCEFCLQKNGALKPTICGKWVHAVCAMFTDGVTFVDHDLMEPVNIKGVSKTKKGQTCAYCHEIKGYCNLCSKQKCKNRIHIRCAQKANGTVEVSKADNTLKYRAYCGDHKPANRRLSSGFVRQMAKKKKADDKKQKEAGSKMNADWITSTIENSVQKQMKRKNPAEEEIVAPKKRWLNSKTAEGKSSKYSMINFLIKFNFNTIYFVMFEFTRIFHHILN